MKVLVTTAHRGVFFGDLVQDKGDSVILANARNCVHWSIETHGFLGLAQRGPQQGSRIGPAVESLELRMGITSIARVTDEAAAAWEAEPWK